MLRTQPRRQAPGTAFRACGLAFTIVVLTSLSSVQAAETCTPVIATVVSIQGSVEGEVEANHSDAGLRKAFDELSVQIARPLAGFAWQAEFLSGLLVDCDDDDFRGRLDGAPQMEQPVELEVLLKL